MRHRWVVAAGMLLASLGAAAAQDWPTKTVRFIVPVTAGSALDITARTIAEQISKQVGQTIIVENRTGAGGTIGTASVAKADPDGYTVLVHAAAITIYPSTFPNAGFHTGRDLVGVTAISSVPLVMIVSPDKYKSVQEVVAAAKAKPGSVNYATVGYGAAAHLTAERLRLAAGFEAQQIPFRGAPEAITEVLAQRVDFFFAPTLTVVPLVREGKLRAIAVSSSKRASTLPEVPTTIEAGYPNSDYNFWIGMFVPAKTPRAIIDKLYAETRKAMMLTSVQDRFKTLGGDPMAMDPDAFNTFVQAEIAMNAGLVKAARIKPNP